MGFLFYGDALGMQDRLRKNPVLGARTLDWIGTSAWTAAQSEVPGLLQPFSGARNLVVFNDSVFFYCDNFAQTVQFSSTLAYELFNANENRGGPIGIRGAIVRTDKAPRIINDSQGDFFHRSQLVVGEISDALVAEKSKVLGCRIVFRRDLLDVEDYHKWDPRLQAKIFCLASFPGGGSDGLLNSSGTLANYCDVCWMNVPSNANFQKLYKTTQTFVDRGMTSQRNALHAGATLALHQVTHLRRKGLVVILRQLWNGINKGRGKTPPNKSDYEKWIELSPTLKAARNGDLKFPIDMK